MTEETQYTEEELALIMGGSHSDTHLPPAVNCNGSPPSLHPVQLFRRISGGGIILLFGDTGSGKTKTVITLTLDALSESMSVTYFDLEGNIHPSIVQLLKDNRCEYKRSVCLRDIYSTVDKIKSDMLVIDSATLQITGRWFGEGQHERGKTLQEVQYLYQKVSDWCVKNDKIAFIVAQPISEFGGRGLFPMGDKCSYMTKTELLLQYEKHPDGITPKTRRLVVFKDRVLPNGMKVCDIKTDMVGVEFGEINPDVLKILTQLGA